MGGYEYGYATFEQLPDIYVDGNKHEPAQSVDVSNTNVTIMKEKNNEDKETQLSLSTKVLIEGWNNDTFCSTMLKLIRDKKCLQINIS